MYVSYTNNSAKKSDHMSTKSYDCPICHHPFTKAQQLGGHLSKAHPGQSRKYEQKKAKRDER